jgi:hypothetical protein
MIDRLTAEEVRRCIYESRLDLAITLTHLTDDESAAFRREHDGPTDYTVDEWCDVIAMWLDGREPADYVGRR